MNEHPKAAAARKQAEHTRIARAHDRNIQLDIIACAKTAGWKFLRIGDYTLCYRPVHRNIIKVGTAIRNPKDAPNHHIGKYVAARNTHLDGQYISLRNPDSETSAEQFLRRMFGESQFTPIDALNQLLFPN